MLLLSIFKDLCWRVPTFQPSLIALLAYFRFNFFWNRFFQKRFRKIIILILSDLHKNSDVVFINIIFNSWYVHTFLIMKYIYPQLSTSLYFFHHIPSQSLPFLFFLFIFYKLLSPVRAAHVSISWNRRSQLVISHLQRKMAAAANSSTVRDGAGRASPSTFYAKILVFCR